MEWDCGNISWGWGRWWWWRQNIDKGEKGYATNCKTYKWYKFRWVTNDRQCYDDCFDFVMMTEWGWQQGQTDDINLGAALDTLGEIRFFSSMFSSSRQNVQCSSMFNVCRTRSPPSTEDCPLNFLKHFYDQSTWKEGLIMDWLWNLFSRRTWKLWPYFQGLGCPGFSLLKVVGTSWWWS